MCRWVVIAMFILSVGSVGYCTDYDGVLSDAKARAVAGDFTMAINLCAGVINAHLGAPVEPRARLLLGHILSKKQAPTAETMAAFAQLVSLFPSSPEVPESLLRIGYLRERLKQSPSEWEQLAQQYPETSEAAEALHCLGHLALRNDDPDTAIIDFKKSAAIARASQECMEDSTAEAGFAHISRYWKSHQVSSIDEAVSTLGRLLKPSTSPEQAVRARLGRGEAFLILAMPERAAMEYKAALKLQPGDAYLRRICLFELSYCYFVSHSWQSAMAGFDKFLDEVPGATLVEKDQHWKQARPDFVRLIVEDPSKAGKLSGLELVTDAAFFKATALLRSRLAAEAKSLADDIAAAFPQLRVSARLEKLRSECAEAVEGGKMR